MPILNWSDEFSVNVEEIDNQHMKLLALVNTLHAAVESQIDKSVLHQMLVDLVEYTRLHFATEERLMAEHGLSQLKLHQREHHLLLRHLNELTKSVSNGRYPTFFSDYDVSNDWFLNHILNFDKELGEQLNTKGVF